MIKNVISDIGGVGAYGVISLCLFVTVFSAALLFALFHKAGYCKRMSALPLDDELSGKDNHEKV